MRESMKLFIKSLANGYQDCLAEGFSFLGEAGVIRPGDRVAIKPNLTYPTFRPGVMTNIEALQALILYLKNFTDHITICESDSGGYNPFSMDAVFHATGIYDFAKRFDVRVVNMSATPSRDIWVRSGLRHLSVPMPTLLLDETDRFITVPVPKVHCNTIVSIGMKNQWGVIQQPSMRLRLHPYFREVIYAINKSLPRTLSVVDGRYGLTRNGPMRGDVIELNWVIVSDNQFLADSVVTRMMGFDPYRVPYLRYALNREHIEPNQEFELNCELGQFYCEQFYLKREWTDLPGLLTFKSRLLAYLGYESVLATPLHWLLYRFREPFY
jgi:uncharacterized protein (DUF362 family)